MQKKIISLILCGIMVINLTGCGNNTETKSKTKVEKEKLTLKDIYLEVLDGKRSFIDEDKEEEYIDKYSDYIDSDNEYTIFDMDNDKKDELVVLLKDYYLILNYDEDDKEVYGFEVVYRSLKELKTNGYYISSGGAGSSYLCHSSFDKNVRNEECPAYMDMSMSGSVYYVVSEQNVSEEVYNKYMDDNYNLSDEVKWKSYDIKLSNKKNESNTIDDGVYTYTYPITGAEGGGSKVTLTIDGANITYNMEYFSNKKIGTYTIDGDSLIATYTKNDYFNQGDNQYESETISEVVTYTIKDGNIVDESKNMIYSK